MEDSIDNTQAKEGTMQQKMNFSQPSLPNEQHHAHKEVSFSQSVISEILQQSTSKQSVLSNVSKYIKMKSTEINVDLTDEQLENLKECKYQPLSTSDPIVLTYLEKKNIINITQLEHD